MLSSNLLQTLRSCFFLHHPTGPALSYASFRGSKPATRVASATTTTAVAAVQRSARAPPPLMMAAESGKTRVLFVCLGNICRSPTAEAVFKQVTSKAGAAEKFDIESCGTGGGSPDWSVLRFARKRRVIGVSRGLMLVGQRCVVLSRRGACHGMLLPR